MYQFYHNRLYIKNILVFFSVHSVVLGYWIQNTGNKYFNNYELF